MAVAINSIFSHEWIYELTETDFVNRNPFFIMATGGKDNISVFLQLFMDVQRIL